MSSYPIDHTAIKAFKYCVTEAIVDAKATTATKKAGNLPPRENTKGSYCVDYLNCTVSLGVDVCADTSLLYLVSVRASYSTTLLLLS